jgi:hypothetical protein
LKKEMTDIIDAYLQRKGIIDKNTDKSVVEELVHKIAPHMHVFYPDHWEKKIGQFWLNPFGPKTGCIRVYEEKMTSKDCIFNKLDAIFNESNKANNQTKELNIELRGMTLQK